MKKKVNDEFATAATADVQTEQPRQTAKEKEEVKDTAVAEVKDDKQQPKQSLFKTLSGVMNVIPTVQDAYTTWIKPIYDNRAQISRRLSAVSTAISIIFFLLYIPFLLLGKLYKDLALGLDIAIYVCIGVYIATIIALFIVTLASGRSTSTAMAKRQKKTRKIVLFIVRIASLAIAITALIISSAGGTKDAAGATLDTIAIIFAVMSIIFSAFPIIFGGMAGFFRWLISPAKAKYTMSFVVLEWYQTLTSDKVMSKSLKKSIKKYNERISGLIDNVILPHLGKKVMKSVDRSALIKLIDGVPPEDKNLCEWMIKQIFDYAEECGYIDANPCKTMELEGNIEMEGKQKKSAAESEKKPTGLSKFSSLFKGRKRRGKDKNEDKNGDVTPE